MVALLILIITNGVFAMAEIAVVSARRARLQARADSGNAGAGSALRLLDNSEDFLATVQIGITLVAILMGAVGSTRLAAMLRPYLADVPYGEEVASVAAVGLVTYLSLVLGELAPKQIGLSNPERIASAVARPMRYLSWVTRPFVRFLSLSTQLVVRLLPITVDDAPAVTEAEIRLMLEQGTEEGVVDPIEEEIVDKMFQVGDLHVNDLMVNRKDIVWIDVDDSLETVRDKMRSSIHSRYPVARGDLDDLVGLVFVKDLAVQMLGSEKPNLEALAKPALLVPSGLPTFELLERFKDEQAQIAFVTDEHGCIIGLITFVDLLESIVGDVPEVNDPAHPTAVRRNDGSWLVDGKLSIDEFERLFGIDVRPSGGRNFYQTVGGFVMNSLGRVPQAGDSFEWGEMVVEVMDMDWRRVDKVLVRDIPEEEEG